MLRSNPGSVKPHKKSKKNQSQIDREYLEHLLGVILWYTGQSFEKDEFWYDTVHDISVRVETKISKLSRCYDSYWSKMSEVLSEERFLEFLFWSGANALSECGHGGLNAAMGVECNQSVQVE
jgi:hypothetical protein